MFAVLPGIVAVIVMLEAQVGTAFSLLVLNAINLCMTLLVAFFAAGAFKYPEVNQ